VQIPLTQERVDLRFAPRGKNRVGAEVRAVKGKGLRILFQQYGSDGLPRRSWGGAPPEGKKMNELLSIRVRQDGKELPLRIGNDKMIWSGLSWAAAELEAGSFDEGLSLDIECMSAEEEELRLEARVYAVGY